MNHDVRERYAYQTDCKMLTLTADGRSQWNIDSGKLLIQANFLRGLCIVLSESDVYSLPKYKEYQRHLSEEDCVN